MNSIDVGWRVSKCVSAGHDMQMACRLIYHCGNSADSRRGSGWRGGGGGAAGGYGRGGGGGSNAGSQGTYVPGSGGASGARRMSNSSGVTPMARGGKEDKGKGEYSCDEGWRGVATLVRAWNPIYPTRAQCHHYGSKRRQRMLLASGWRVVSSRLPIVVLIVDIADALRLPDGHGHLCRGAWCRARAQAMGARA